MEPIEPVEIEAGPVRLRPWREDDADAVSRQQDPDIRMWAVGGVTPGTPSRCCAVTGPTTAPPGRVDAAPELLGSVSSTSTRRAQIGYWTAPAAGGGGRSGRRGLPLVFGPCVERIELCHAVENPRRPGGGEGRLHLEGLRRSYRYGDGVKHDELIWARLSDDPAPELSSRS